MTHPTARGRLVRKYVVVLLALVGGVLMASSLVELYFSYRETQRAIVKVERAKAVAAAARIEEFLKELEGQVRETTRTASDDPDASQVRQGSLGFREGLGAAMAEQRELDFLRVLRNVPAVRELSHLDLSGKEQLRVSRLEPDVVGSQRDFSRAPAFLEAKSGKTYWSPVQLKNESELSVTLAVPVGKYAVEVTTAEVTLGAILKMVSQIEAGPGAHAYVVDSRGRLVAHPDSRVLRSTPDVSHLAQVKSARADRSAVGEDARATVVADGLGGGRVLAAHAPIGSLGWLVFVERPAADAYAPLRDPIIRSVVIFVLGLGLSVLASLLLARRMVAPIRVLQEGATRIGAGELGHRIEIRTGDELQALGDELNRTAGQLQESYATLEQKVEERTRELAERTQDLTRSVEELRALGEVGQAVSGSLDIDSVLTSIVTHAVELSRSDAGTIYELEENTQTFAPRANYGTPEALIDALHRSHIGFGETLVGQAATTRAASQVADLEREPEHTLRFVIDAGYRALLAVPLLREDRVIGALVVRRKSAGAFPSATVELLQTFATQSVIAIQNARLFREIDEKSRALELASRHKSQFLANMSHELRTPMNAVLGYTDLVLDGIFGDVPDPIRDTVERIKSNGQHLLGLINDVLDLSKMEAGQLTLSLGDYVMDNIVYAVVAAVESLAAAKKLALEASVPPDLLPGYGDERRLTQVLLNLAGNAIKFTDAGRVSIEVLESDGAFVVSVTDTGPGIAEADRQKIFEEFQQADSSSTRAKGGTGLGLSISRRIVELHGGRLWVDSVLGQGSTFHFTVPIRVASETERA